MINYKKNFSIFLGLGVVLFGLFSFFSSTNAQPSGTCQITQVMLDPAGNQLGTWYRDSRRTVNIKAKLTNCDNSTVHLSVWGRTSIGNIKLDEGTFSPSTSLVELDDDFLIGEDGCISSRAPQCQYFVTFTDGPNQVVFTSEPQPLFGTQKGTIGFNCDGLCNTSTQISNLSGLTSLQTSYSLTLNTGGAGSGQVLGGGTFPTGSEVNARAIPDSGNQFVEWTEGGNRVSVSDRIKVLLSNADRTLTAVFASGTAPALTTRNNKTLSADGPCSVGPVAFSPHGNLLFAYTGGSFPVDIEWLATNCYGKTLQVTIGAKTALGPAPVAVITKTLDLDDSTFGFDPITNPYSPEKDLIRYNATANLNDSVCDGSLFPGCQYFIEIEDISPVSSLGVLYSSRGGTLRTTSKDAVGFHCSNCSGSGPAPRLTSGTWIPNPLAKEYKLSLKVDTNNSRSFDTKGGFVKGAGTYSINSEVNIDAIPNPGYIFSHWQLEDNSQVSSQRAVVTMDSRDRELVAHFTSNTSRVLTVNIQGDGTVIGNGTYPEGSEIEVVATPDTGWRLEAWRQQLHPDGDVTKPLEWFVVGRAPGRMVTLNDDITLEVIFVPMDDIGLGITSSGSSGGLVPCQNNCNFNHIIELIEKVIDYIFVLVLPLAGVLAVVTGIMFLTSGGNPSAREKAKKAFGKFIIGLIIILIAWLLVATVLNILKVEGAYSFLDL